MKTLTKKQKLVLDFIKNFVSDNGYAPSYAEIAKGMGLSSQSTVHAHIENLKQKGYLTKRWNGNRSIDLKDDEDAHFEVELPLVGKIAAGTPIEALQSSDVISVPSHLTGRGSLYALQVEGDSMRDAHVLDKDYIIVRYASTATAGDMVVALIDDYAATLKHIYHEGANVKLKPANPDFPAQIYEADRVKVQGVVIAVFRKYGA